MSKKDLEAENERLREFVEDFISVQKENYGNATNTHLKMIDLAKQAQELRKEKE